MFSSRLLQCLGLVQSSLLSDEMAAPFGRYSYLSSCRCMPSSFSLKGAKHLFCQNIFGKWDEDDYIFAKKFLPYLFAPGKVHMPPQREVKSMQRVADGTLLFAGIFAAISGMIMWLNTGLLLAVNGLSISPRQHCLFAKTVHIVAFLVFIVFGLGHVYLGGGIFQPYRGTARLMFGDGKVSEADAAYHWGYWAATSRSLLAKASLKNRRTILIRF